MIISIGGVIYKNCFSAFFYTLYEIKRLFGECFTRVEITVTPDKLISRSLRSTLFFVACFVLFLFFLASLGLKVACRIISCDLLCMLMYAYMLISQC